MSPADTVELDDLPRVPRTLPHPMQLLAAGIPLTLLFDLVEPIRSWDLARNERSDTSWIEPHAA
jgi:hypothetical protein